MIACPQRVTGTGLKDQQVFGVAGYCQLFSRSVETLRSMLADKGDGAELVWDKVRTHREWIWMGNCAGSKLEHNILSRYNRPEKMMLS